MVIDYGFTNVVTVCIRAKQLKSQSHKFNSLGTDLFKKILAFGTDLICRCTE